MLHTHKVAGSNPARNNVFMSSLLNWNRAGDGLQQPMPFNLASFQHGFYGVMVSTLDFESSDPSSNLGRTSIHLTPWRNGSASDSRSEGCVFESRRGQIFLADLWRINKTVGLPPMRIELMTFGLQDQRSATEL